MCAYHMGESGFPDTDSIITAITISITVTSKHCLPCVVGPAIDKSIYHDMMYFVFNVLS